MRFRFTIKLSVNADLVVSAPIPNGVQSVLSTVCKDAPGAFNDTNIWVYSRGEGRCVGIDTHSLDELDIAMTNKIVYVFQVTV